MMKKAYKVTLVGYLNLRYYVIYYRNHYYVIDYFDLKNPLSYLHLIFPSKFFSFQLSYIHNLNNLDVKPIPLLLKHWKSINVILSVIVWLLLIFAWVNRGQGEIKIISFFREQFHLLIIVILLAHLLLYSMLNLINSLPFFKINKNFRFSEKISQPAMSLKNKILINFIFPFVRLLGIAAICFFAIDVPNMLLSLIAIVGLCLALPVYSLLPLLNVVEFLEEKKYVMQEERV
ncbi:hypothetical protein AB3331_11250 [Streptococcus sp. H49]|uniref:hypothetical protein n=1 Tax=Streptococcus huangxiaojuni TaxID=3237239 RepID=UPI0034A1CC84